MTFQLVRSPNGKLRGIAILLGRGHIEAGRHGETSWRICDSCTEQPAIVYCKTDNIYVCERCLPVHTMPGFCRFLSVRAARELSTAALIGNAVNATAVEIWR